MGSLSDLKQQEWFTRVKRGMNLYGVTDPIWESTLLVESGGDPAAHNYNPATGDDSYGLFQLNRNGGLGAKYSPDYLKIPENNAGIAGYQMGQAIGKLPQNSTYADQLRAVEKAGWNGSLAQDGLRQAELKDVLRQEGFKQSQDASPQDGSSPFTFNPFDAIARQSEQEAKNIKTNGGFFNLPDFNVLGHRAVFYSVVVVLIVVGAILIAAGVQGQAQEGLLNLAKAK